MIGHTLGRFRITARLGQGGIATVWRAEDTLLGRAVALKILSDDTASSPKARRRFLHEAKAAAMLDHPGIVAVYDAGESGGKAYIALSLVDGETLSERAARSLMPIEEAIRVVAEAAGALEHAHQRGVIHRDVTGRNIMIARDGRVVVLDFGLAVVAGLSRLTSTENVVGTVAYMAPEVAKGGDADLRSDIFSLGVVLFEALTGAFPFTGDRLETMIFALLNHPPRVPSTLRPDVPAALDAVVLRALAREPADRYASAREMAEDLARLGAAPRGEGDEGALRLASSAPARPSRSAEVTPGGRPDPLYLAIAPFEVDGDHGGLDVARTLTSRVTSTLSAVLAGQDRVRLVASESSAPPAGAGDLEGFAARVGANAVLQGRATASGSEIRVAWSVLDPVRAERWAGAVVDGSSLQPFDLESRVIASVTNGLGLPLAALERTSGSRPRDPAASERLERARRYLERYDNEASVDGAIGILEQLIASEGESAVLCATLARAYLMKYRLTRERVWESRAASACDRAVALDPEDPNVSVALGDLLHGTGRSQGAVAEYERALALQPQSPDAELGLIRALDSAGRSEEAITVGRKWTTTRRMDWRGFGRLAFVHFKRGEYAEAADLWGHAARLVPDNAEVRYSLGAAWYHLDRWADALVACRESVAIQPNDSAYTNIGTILWHQGHFVEATEAFEKAIAITPTNAVWWGNLGNACHMMPSHQDRAEEALDRAILLMRERLARDPGDVNGKARLAGWLSSRGRFDEALAMIGPILNSLALDVQSVAAAVLVYFEAGRRTEGLRWLREALARGYGVAALRRNLDLKVRGILDDVEVRQLLEGPQAEPGEDKALSRGGP